MDPFLVTGILFSEDLDQLSLLDRDHDPVHIRDGGLATESPARSV
jgi:hypothetical protein